MQVEPATVSKRAWSLIKWSAAVFLPLVGAAMLWSDLQVRQDDPLKSALLKQYKEKLRSNPTDEQLKSQIRQLDLQLRNRYFQHVARKSSGVYILIAGAVVFLVASNHSAKQKSLIPGPKDASLALRSQELSRWAVAAAGLAAGATLCVAGLTFKSSTSRQAVELSKLFTNETRIATQSSHQCAEETGKNWSRFRGPDGNATAAVTNIPASWGPGTGYEVLWKAPMPAGGYNSPILWGNRLFLSTASDTDCIVYCFDSETGRNLWREPIAGAAAAFKADSQVPVLSAANATMTSDGERVFAFFGSGDLACLTVDGKPVWSKRFGPLKNPYGHASSLVIAENRLILQLDQGEAEAGQSKLYAFDPRSGQILWQRHRRVGSSWATPILINAAGKAQLITEAVPAVVSYALDSGAELWRVDGLNNEITPSPIFSAGLVFAVSPSEKLFAIAPDGSGDVTRSKVIWTAEENVPDIASPVCDGKLLFALTSAGVLTCFQASDGKKQWEHDFAMDFHSSPSIAGGRIYLFGQKGTVLAVEAAPQFKELFRTEMPDAFDASPAFADGRIFLRGETNLWCIGPSTLKVANQ